MYECVRVKYLVCLVKEQDLPGFTKNTQSTDTKQKIIQKAKRLNFRQEISKTTETPQGLWKLARWAKDKSQLAREVPKMPTLHFNGQTASTFDEQTNMLKNTFFPHPPPADLSDIAGSFYPAPTQSPDIISKSEIMGALQRLKAG